MPALVTTGPAILTAFAFAAAFACLGIALGRHLLRWLGVAEHASFGEWSIVAGALGAGALQLIPLALGAAGVLSVLSIRISIGLLMLVLAPDLVSLARKAWQARAASPTPSAWHVAFVVALLPALGAAALLAVTPTLDPDGLGYHLTVPKLWLHSGSLRYLPTYPYSNTPMGVEMLFAIALACVGDAGAKTLHFGFGILGAVALYLTGKRLRSELLGAAAVALYLVGPFAVVPLLGWAYLEGLTVCAMGTSALAWVIWFRERKPGWLRASFALAGLGVSFKLTAALFPIAIAALTVATLVEPARGAGRLRARALLLPWQLYALALLPVAPWLIRSTVVTGNPIFPLFARLIPSRDLSPALSKQFDDYNRYMLWATHFGVNWSLTQRKAILSVVAVAALALAGSMFFRLRSYMARAIVIVILFTVLAQLGAVGLYARYWSPSFAVMALPILLLIPELSPRLQRAGWGLLVIGTGLASLYQMRQILYSVRLDVSGLVRTAFGIESQRTYLLAHVPLYPLYERANQLPPDSKIVLSTYCGGFYVDRTTYCAEAIQDSLRLTSWDFFIADVNRLGATHVFAPTKLLALAKAGRVTPRLSAQPGQGSVSEIYRAQQNEYVGRLLADHGKLLATASDTGLYEVDLSGPVLR